LRCFGGFCGRDVPSRGDWQQIEELRFDSEEAARRRVLYNVSSYETETLDVNVESEGAKPVKGTTDANTVSSPLVGNLSCKRSLAMRSKRYSPQLKNN
jgi:hypothetical protein